jgi:hypothetical protein
MSVAYLLMLLMMLVDIGVWLSVIAGLTLGALLPSAFSPRVAALFAVCAPHTR